VSSAAALWDPDREAAVADHNDLANANLFEELAEGRFRHAGALKTWLAWNGVHWDREAAVELQRALEGVAAEVKRRAELVPDQQARTRELKWAVTCGETWRYASLEKMLTWRLDVRLELLDKRPMLLACGNGVVDLAAGSFAPGRPDDWLTRATDVMYVPRAKCPRWDKFMDEIMLGDKEMVAYLWRVLGYCLTGDTSERAFFLLHGHGRNGKSTFMEVLHAMLSPGGRGYAQKARFTTFLQKGQVNGGANDDVAHLAGARLVVAAESSGRAPLDVPLVKELTGSDTIRARHLYGREFEFRPSFKLFLVTNQVPPIHESTYALWDRLHYIPFNYRVPDKDVDARLPIALMGELEGILAKAVAACREWLADGLQPPAKVLKAREALQEANDMVGEFIRECCEQRDGARQAHPELYSVFNGWSKRAGLKTPPTSKHLADALETRGWEFRRGAGNVRTWQNWELKAGQKDFGLDGPI
jgi:putative DNA primase/helicase